MEVSSHPGRRPYEEPQYLLNRRLGGLQGQSGHFGKDKNLLSLPGFEPQIIHSIS